MAKKMTTYFKQISNLIAANYATLIKTNSSASVSIMPFLSGGKTCVTVSFYGHDKRTENTEVCHITIGDYYETSENNAKIEEIKEFFADLKN